MKNLFPKGNLANLFRGSKKMKHEKRKEKKHPQLKVSVKTIEYK